MRVVETKRVEARDLYLAIGLPDVGLVGSISSAYLVDVLGMEEAGYIESDILPPLMVIHKSEAKHPIRLYTKDNLALLVSEVPIPPEAINLLGKIIVEWAKTHNSKLILSLAAIPIPNRVEVEEPEVYGLAVTEQAKGAMPKSGLKPLEEGMIVGPYAAIIRECIKAEQPCITILAQSHYQYPDPGAAAAVIMAMSKTIGIEVDVKPLLEQAEEIRLKTRELMRRTQQQMRSIGKGQEQEIPLMYR